LNLISFFLLNLLPITPHPAPSSFHHLRLLQPPLNSHPRPIIRTAHSTSPGSPTPLTTLGISERPVRGGGPRGDVGAVLLDQQGGFVGAVVEEALPAGDFGERFRQGREGGGGARWRQGG